MKYIFEILPNPPGFFLLIQPLACVLLAKKSRFQEKHL